MLHLVSEISEQVGILNARLGENVPSPMLRKKNQIKTIHSSIHACSTMSLSLFIHFWMVTDVWDAIGKPCCFHAGRESLRGFQ